jgi:hypothetical protein
MRSTFSPSQSSYGELFLSAASLLWLMFLFGALSQSFARSLSVFLFDLLGAFILIVLSRYLPSVLRYTVMGLGVALLFIAVGDGNLAVALMTQTDLSEWILWRRPFQFFGSFLVVVFTCLLPFALAREGLYQRVYPLRVVLGSVLAAMILTAGLVWLRGIEVYQMVFFFVGSFVALIFAFQHAILAENELAMVMRQLANVFILSSFGRLILIMLGGSWLGDLMYDLCWCLGITAASWTLIVRSK